MKKRGRIRPPAQRHVRAGDLGQPARPAGPGAGPHGPEAALLRVDLPGGGLAFGSEPKAILAHPEIGRQLDRASLARYLSMNMCRPPIRSGGRSASCPRGHLIDLGRRARSALRRYWNPPAHRIGRRSTSSTRPSDSGVEFRDSVARHRRSDVPIGRLPVGRGRFVERGRRALRGRAGEQRPHLFDRLRGSRASTRAATRGRSPAIWGPTTTSGRFRSRPPTTFCPRWPAGSTSRSATRRSCRLTC